MVCVSIIAKVLDLTARVAISLVERWGTVAGNPDGEDSSGRSKLRLMTSQELCDRSVASADLIVQALKKRGNIMVGKSMAESKEEIKKLSEADKY